MIEMTGGGDDAVGIFACGDRVGFFLDDLGVANNAIEWRAQFVTDLGQKLGLEAA